MTAEPYQDNWRGSEEERNREPVVQGGSIFQAEKKAKWKCLLGTLRGPLGGPQVPQLVKAGKTRRLKSQEQDHTGRALR